MAVQKHNRSLKVAAQGLDFMTHPYTCGSTAFVDHGRFFSFLIYTHSLDGGASPS
jgi:hypothetical protein